MATLKDLLVSGTARVIGNITGKSFIKEGGTSSQFLKADGSVDSNSYSKTSHNHSGTYKTVQTAVTSPTASSTATAFIDTITQNTNGVITATKKTIPTATSENAGITKVGASGGAAAYSHTHTTKIATSSGTNQITLAFGTKYAITAGGTSYVFTMPSNPNTNTTYTIATGDANGQIKVTPSSGSAYNVSVKGLGSAAYTASTAYAEASHTHSYLPLAGGEMTGSVCRNYTVASENPVIDVASANQDVWIWRVSSSDYSTGNNYGFGIKYLGTGSGNNNDLVLYADNQTGSPKEAYRVHQDGSIVFTSTPKVGTTSVSLEGHTHNYATSNHNHSGVYKPVQTAVTSPTASSTATAFIDTITQNANGVITPTKKTIPTATSEIAGITKVGASGGAAAYSHTHTTKIATSSGTNQITLAFGTKYAITAGGTSYVFTMPSNPNTNTTYTIATGDANGQIKVTPSSGSAYNVSVKGLGSAAYTASTAYATSNHNHSGTYKPVQTAVSNPTASGTSTSFIATASQNANGVITVTKASLPTASSSVAGIMKLGASGGAAAYSHTHNYLPLGGGTMTGNISWESSDALPQQTSPKYILCIDSFSDGGATKWADVSALKTELGKMPPSSHTQPFSTITSRGEAYLAWGGKNLYSSYSPIDAAMVGRLGANRTAFISPNAVTVEYSRDGGTTWTDYGATDTQKRGFFTDFNSGFIIGKSTSSNPANANCQLRVTLSTAGGSGVYTVLNKFIIYDSVSGSTGCWCSIDARLQSNVTNNTNTWVNFADEVEIGGWSGYNVINTSGITTYGNNTSTQYGQIRFTFGCTGGSSDYSGLNVYGVNCYGGFGWTVPSTMARNGNLYTFDMSQNATFPAIVKATNFVKSGGTSAQFLKADGSVDTSSYSKTSHNHSGTYKPVQTAVTSPTASSTTATAFIDTITQNANGVITATKKTLPTATSEIAGITKVGATGGASAYGHTHTTSISASTGSSQIILEFGTKYKIEAGGTSYVFAMPENPNSDSSTTYTFATGDSNGQIKVTPSSGSAYNVSVKGLGSAAYTASTAYATSGHTHTTKIATSTSTNQITLAFGTRYAITAGGTSYVFTMPDNPNSDTKVTQNVSTTSSWRPILMGAKSFDTVGTTPAEVTDISYVSKTIQCSPGQGAIFATKYIVENGTASHFLKGDGSIDNNSYSKTNHTHNTSIATSSGTSQITLAFGTKYAITAGGKSFVFTMPTSSGNALATPEVLGGNPGSVIPVSTFETDSTIQGNDYGYVSANTLRTDDFVYMLPIAMDKEGRLVLPINQAFAQFLMDCGYESK